MSRRVVRRTAAVVGATLFAVMAGIQWNDPDPLYWFSVYAAVSLVMAGAVAGYRMPRFALVVLGAVIAGLLIAAPGFVDYLRSADWASIGGRMRMDRPYIESAREFLGLLMAAAALLLLTRGRSA